MRDDLPPPPWIIGEPRGPFALPRPSMRGRYLIRSRRSAEAIGWLDRALALIPVAVPPVPERFDRLLLANWGHLGDVVTTFGVVSALRDRYPGVRIGMIVANAGRPAIERAGLLDEIHVVDHWLINRGALPGRAKRAHYRATRARAMRDMRAIGYQAAIDLYPFFPPAHPLFHSAGIPLRAGFTSGGFGPLLTHPVAWPNAAVPISDQYGALLDAFAPGANVPIQSLRPLRDRGALSALPNNVRGVGRYVVLHPGAGVPYKEWEIGHWRDLAAAILAAAPDRSIVVTGAGARDIAMAAGIAALSPAIVSIAGRADWETFVSVVAHAELVVCPDTAAGHVAAAVDVPVVSIFTGTNIAEQWQPNTPRGRLLRQSVTCAPCNRPGCETMACIRQIPPEAVFAAMRDLGWPWTQARAVSQ